MNGMLEDNQVLTRQVDVFEVVDFALTVGQKEDGRYAQQGVKEDEFSEVNYHHASPP